MNHVNKLSLLHIKFDIFVDNQTILIDQGSQNEGKRRNDILLL